MNLIIYWRWYNFVLFFSAFRTRRMMTKPKKICSLNRKPVKVRKSRLNFCSKTTTNHTEKVIKMRFKTKHLHIVFFSFSPLNQAHKAIQNTPTPTFIVTQKTEPEKSLLESFFFVSNALDAASKSLFICDVHQQRQPSKFSMHCMEKCKTQIVNIFTLFDVGEFVIGRFFSSVTSQIFWLILCLYLKNIEKKTIFLNFKRWGGISKVSTLLARFIS